MRIVFSLLISTSLIYLKNGEMTSHGDANNSLLPTRKLQPVVAKWTTSSGGNIKCSRWWKERTQLVRTRAKLITLTELNWERSTVSTIDYTMITVITWNALWSCVLFGGAICVIRFYGPNQCLYAAFKRSIRVQSWLNRKILLKVWYWHLTVLNELCILSDWPTWYLPRLLQHSK